MKVAIVADWLTDRGGAERTILAMHDVFPKADIFTTVYDPEVMGPEFSRLNITTSFLQWIPGAKKHRKKMINLMPMGIEDLDLRGYDVVISSSSAVGHGAITHPETLHICYCHNPMRFCWDGCQQYVSNSGFSKWMKMLIPLLLTPVRVWDYWAADRPDIYVANSKFVQKRIQKYFRQPSELIYPPVETSRFRTAHADESKEFYLVVSRLVEFKRVDLAIEACNKMKKTLKIVGTGSYAAELEAMAGPTVELLGYVEDVEVAALMRECKALIFTQIEDFGITPLEVMASGRPVIAYKAGGALETVIHGRTGMFFEEQTVESLSAVIEEFEDFTFDPEKLQAHANTFSYERFCREFKEFVEEKWMKFSKNL
jgi:glycosyltransferase involved in cell wall biosynthesis